MSGIYIIAEAGVNHNGSLDIALELVDVAASAGVDAVKFQTFFASNLVTPSAGKAEYQKDKTGQTGTQQDMLSKLELSRDDHNTLKLHAEKAGIEFLSTPFGLEELNFLVNEVGIGLIKIPSGEITNGPLLLESAKTQKSVILSTGMSSLEEIKQALSILAFGYVADENQKPGLAAFAAAFEGDAGQSALREKVTVLHCTTQYPTPLADVNLRAMDTLHSHFGLPVGYSDHTAGILTSVAAAARGACVLEKHFTLDRNMEGPDHGASLEPDELTELVSAVRDVEKLLGSTAKQAGEGESQNISVARKSLVAAVDIAAGENFTRDNVIAKRPSGGLSPIAIWGLIGKAANRDYQGDEKIDAEILEA